jgi:hypothetical protein
MQVEPDRGTEPSSEVKRLPANDYPDIKWPSPELPAYIAAISQSGVERRAQRTNRLIVSLLLVACVAMSLVDLLMLLLSL